MPAQRDSKGRFVKGSGGGKKKPPAIRPRTAGKPSAFSSIHIENDLGEIFRNIKRNLPIAFESSALEAAEVAAFYLDKSTRQFLNKRSTGTLANSWNATLIKTSDYMITAGAYSDLPYASIHETGGTVKSSRPGGSLAIPLTRAARNVGSPKNMSGLKMIPGSVYGGGAPRLWANGVTQYVLPKSVYIPPTGYISYAAAQSAPDIEEIIGNNTVDVIAGRSVFEVR